MTHGIRMERLAVAAHIVAMVFGVAGLVLVLPHPAWVLALPAVGQRLFAWSMAGGGIVYILLGALAVILYGVRVLGARLLWGFFVPAVGLSLASELLGTSTGFPFGHYGYLDGLGYKIAGDFVPGSSCLVPLLPEGMAVVGGKTDSLSDR